MTDNTTAIFPETLLQLINNGASICIVDVREAEELKISSFEGSIHLPLMSLPDNLDRLKQLSADPSFEARVLVCRSGQRSEMARQWLVEQDVKNFYNLAGGINAFAKSCNPSFVVY